MRRKAQASWKPIYVIVKNVARKVNYYMYYYTSKVKFSYVAI